MQVAQDHTGNALTAVAWLELIDRNFFKTGGGGDVQRLFGEIAVLLGYDR